jgi:hypothetical protein
MTREEFFDDFIHKIINGVYYNMPKDYRKSREYDELSLDAKFQQALNHSSFKTVLFDVLSDYYDRVEGEVEDLAFEDEI